MIRHPLLSLVRRILPPVLVGLLMVNLMQPAGIGAEKYEDFTPGRTFPKEGVTPDARKVIYVVYWHHKLRTEEFGFQDYFAVEDGVNYGTARKLEKMMEKRYPNLHVYVNEVNQANVKEFVEKEKARVKKPWVHVEVKQPEKIEVPKRVGEKQFAYADGNPTVDFTDHTPKAPPEFAVVEEVQKDGKIKVHLARIMTINKIVTVEVVRDGKKVLQTRNVPQDTVSTLFTMLTLKDEAGFDAAGKKLSKEDVLARLKPSQPVLLTNEPRGVDPTCLAVLKADTIILLR